MKKEFDKNKLIKRIREIRKGKGLIQEKVAEEIGIETSNFSKIETGKFAPSLSSLYKIVNALGVSYDEVFEYEHLENEKTLDEMNLKIYNNLSLKKKQSIYKIMRALEDLN